MEETPMFIVAENRVPLQLGAVQYCGMAYAAFGTREEAVAYQTANAITAVTHIEEI